MTAAQKVVARCKARCNVHRVWFSWVHFFGGCEKSAERRLFSQRISSETKGDDTSPTPDFSSQNGPQYLSDIRQGKRTASRLKWGTDNEFSWEKRATTVRHPMAGSHATAVVQKVDCFRNDLYSKKSTTTLRCPIPLTLTMFTSVCVLCVPRVISLTSENEAGQKQDNSFYS